MNTVIRVGLLVFEPMRRAGLNSICSQIKNVQVVHGDLNSLLADESMRFIIVDLGTTQKHSSEQVELIRLIHEQRPEILQIVLGVENDELVMEAILAGARAFLDYNAIPIAVQKAIEDVINGTIWARRIVLSRVIDQLMLERIAVAGHSTKGVLQKLTAREHQVLGLILEANSNREIARKLGIEERTVKAHLGHLMRKVGVTNRVELSIWALKRKNNSSVTEIDDK